VTLGFLIFFAYFLGAVPFGLLLGRIFADVDVRSLGSGNIGATNVNRVLGRKLGAATLLCDVVKALLPTLLARLFLGSELDVALVGLAAVVGHCFPIYLGFKGGKGVATAFGVILILAPVSAALAIMVWILAFRLSKISAMGALCAAAVIPVAVFFERSISIALVCLAISAVVIFRHRENIERIRKGAELRVEG
jgi:glycerol-3-phosphate acyltransferase PlsY